MIILLFFVASFLIDIITDVTKIRKGQSPKHGWSALYRTAGIGTGCYLEWNDWLIAAIGLIALTFVYWIVFDLLINVAMGWAILYSGKTSVLDRILGQISDEKEVIIKVGALLLTLVAFFFVYKERNTNPNDKLKEP